MHSLVKKDAGMLDAFGKGASEDIRAAKSELYAQMTWDPLTSQSLNTPPQITTPMPSPPPSPKTESGANEANAGAPPTRALNCSLFVSFLQRIRVDGRRVLQERKGPGCELWCQ